MNYWRGCGIYINIEKLFMLISLQMPSIIIHVGWSYRLEIVIASTPLNIFFFQLVFYFPLYFFCTSRPINSNNTNKDFYAVHYVDEIIILKKIGMCWANCIQLDMEYFDKYHFSLDRASYFVNNKIILAHIWLALVQIDHIIRKLI